MQLRDISVYSYETITVRASVLRGPELDLSAVIVQFVIKLYLNKTIDKHVVYQTKFIAPAVNEIWALL